MKRHLCSLQAEMPCQHSHPALLTNSNTFSRPVCRVNFRIKQDLGMDLSQLLAPVSAPNEQRSKVSWCAGAAGYQRAAMQGCCLVDENCCVCCLADDGWWQQMVGAPVPEKAGRVAYQWMPHELLCIMLSKPACLVSWAAEPNQCLELRGSSALMLTS